MYPRMASEYVRVQVCTTIVLILLNLLIYLILLNLPQ